MENRINRIGSGEVQRGEDENIRISMIQRRELSLTAVMKRGAFSSSVTEEDFVQGMWGLFL